MLHACAHREFAGLKAFLRDVTQVAFLWGIVRSSLGVLRGGGPTVGGRAIHATTVWPFVRRRRLFGSVH